LKLFGKLFGLLILSINDQRPAWLD